MRIRHKGLRALAEQDRGQQLPGDLVPKLRRVLTLLDEAHHPGDIAAQPGYRLHPLKGDMADMDHQRVEQLARGVPIRGQRSRGRRPGGLPLKERSADQWRC